MPPGTPIGTWCRARLEQSQIPAGASTPRHHGRGPRSIGDPVGHGGRGQGRGIGRRCRHALDIDKGLRVGAPGAGQRPWTWCSAPEVRAGALGDHRLPSLTTGGPARFATGCRSAKTVRDRTGPVSHAPCAPIPVPVPRRLSTCGAGMRAALCSSYVAAPSDSLAPSPRVRQPADDGNRHAMVRAEDSAPILAHDL